MLKVVLGQNGKGQNGMIFFINPASP